MYNEIIMALNLAQPSIKRFTDRSLLKAFKVLKAKSYIGLVEYEWEGYDVFLTDKGQKLKDQLGLS